jgi:hypothetical protein
MASPGAYSSGGRERLPEAITNFTFPAAVKILASARGFSLSNPNLKRPKNDLIGLGLYEQKTRNPGRMEFLVWTVTPPAGSTTSCPGIGAPTIPSSNNPVQHPHAYELLVPCCGRDLAWIHGLLLSNPNLKRSRTTSEKGMRNASKNRTSPGRMNYLV